MTDCPVRIAIGRYDDVKRKWDYQRIQTTLDGQRGQNRFDATIATRNHERLAQAAGHLTSLGHNSLVDLLAEYCAVTNLKLVNLGGSSYPPVKADLSAIEVDVANNEEPLHDKARDRPARTPDVKSDTMESRATKPKDFILISSSDHEEFAVPKIENMKNGRATIRGHRGRFSTANTIKPKPNSKHQQDCPQNQGLQSYKISKPSSTSRRKSTTIMEERSLDALKLMNRAKLNHGATASSSSKSAKRGSMADMVDLCSTDSENTPPQAVCS